MTKKTEQEGWLDLSAVEDAVIFVDERSPEEGRAASGAASPGGPETPMQFMRWKLKPGGEWMHMFRIRVGDEPEAQE